MQIIAVHKGLRGDFRVVAVSTCVEETFIVWIFAGIEDVVAFCASTERSHVAGNVWPQGFALTIGWYSDRGRRDVGKTDCQSALFKYIGDLLLPRMKI